MSGIDLVPDRVFLGELGGCAFGGSYVHWSIVINEKYDGDESHFGVYRVNGHLGYFFFLECKCVSFVQQTGLACFCFFSILYSKFCVLGQGFCLFVCFTFPFRNLRSNFFFRGGLMWRARTV